MRPPGMFVHALISWGSVTLSALVTYSGQTSARLVTPSRPMALISSFSRISSMRTTPSLPPAARPHASLEAWGLAAGGKDGVVRMLEILENELISAMGLLGVTSLAEVCPEYVTRADSVTLPHDMSAWTNMPGGRIF